MKLNKPPILKKKATQAQSQGFSETFSGASDETIAKILRILHRHDIDPDDPMFLIFGAITHAQLALEPIPEHLEDLKEGIEAVLQALREQVEVSFKRHEDLNHDFYVTAERLSAILNQKLFEIEHYEQRRQNTLSISFRMALLWCLVTSVIGGITGGLVISTLMIISAAQ